MRSFVSAIAVVVALHVAGYAYLTLSWIGFPDGHVTSLDGTRRVQLWSVAGVSVALMLGGVAGVLGFARGRERWGKVLFSLLVLFIAAGLIADAHLASISGRGG